MAATENKNNFVGESSKLSLRVLDCYSLRAIFDVLKSYRDTIVLRFTAKGFSIIECGGRETSTQHYEIYGDELLHYSFPLPATVVDEDGEEVENVYPTGISATTAFDTLKVDSKKEPTYIYATINRKDMTNNGLIVGRSSTSTTLEGLSQIDTRHIKVTPAKLINYYDKLYADKEPNSRVPTAAFVKTFSNIKNRKCNILSFELNEADGSIMIKGKQDSKVITVIPLPAGENDINEDQNYDDEDPPAEEPDLIFDNMSFVLDTPKRYSIDLKVTNVLWFLKIGRLASTSILRIYLVKDGPLVMRTPLGLYGMATYSFNSDIDK